MDLCDSEVRRLCKLEDENAKLKIVVADFALGKYITGSD